MDFKASSETAPRRILSRVFNRSLIAALVLAFAAPAFAIDPTVSITGPSSGTTVNSGVNLNFTGTANDAEDGNLTASIAWSSSLDGALGTGGSINVNNLSVGTHTITASVTDSEPVTVTDTISVTINNVAPTVSISGPGNGSSFASGANVNFTGTASDTEDGNLSASIAWSSSIDGSLGSGASVASNSLSVGAHTITASVTDSNGAPGSDTISITISNNAPSVNITAPPNGTSVVFGTNVNFTGTASDNEDGNLTGSISWSSNLDGGLGNGGSVNVNDLSVGSHTITAAVTDSDGGNGSASINVTVTNNAPTVNITQPGNGSSFNFGTNVNFRANATDPEDNNGPLTASIAWTSSVDGAIGSGGNINVNSLSIGAHTITASVTDSDGAPGSASINITITNNAPVVSITSPGNGASISSGTNINFVANATDAEDDNATLTAAIAWSSNVDGALGTGGSINVSTLTVGAHTITASVSDSDGSPGSASINITITNNDPVVTITAPADGTTVNFGTNVNLQATATDTEDDDTTLTGSIAWSSSLDGALGTGGSVNTTTLTVGVHVITASVTDSNGGNGSDSINLTINNEPPAVTGQVPLTTPEETPLTLVLANFTITDPDSDPADFTLTVLPGANYTVLNNQITPAVDFNGPLTVGVIVSDLVDDSATFNATVDVTPVNDRPVISGQRALSTAEDTSITVVLTDLTITDPDSSNFTLTLGAGANFTVAGAVVTPAENFNGNINVPVTVTDDSGELNATSLQATLVITIDPVNDFPILSLEIPDQNAVEASQFVLDVSAFFEDADGDSLTYSINPNELPVSGNITFNTNTGVFSGTPTIDDARDNDPYIINVTATDGQPGTVPATDQFNLVIAALDRANVSLDIVVAPNPAMMNDQLRWTFNVRNAPGQQGAANVELNGSFIGSVTNANSASSCTIQPPAGQITNFNCIVGSIPPGGVTSIVINTDATDVGDVTTFAIAAGTQPVPIDPNIDDNANQTAVGVAEVFSNGAVQILGNTNVLSVAAGDIDGDGSDDIVVGTAAGQPVQVYLSGGFRDFSASPLALADNNANEGIAVADFDGNGTNDIVVANGGGQPDMVYSNDGAGNFSAMATLENSFATDVAVGDFDNDTAPDIAIAAVGPNPVYLGNGNGGFSLHRELGNANSRAVAIGRFDDNNRDDVAFANIGAQSRVWTKNGGGGFSSADEINIGDASSVTVGDFGGNARDDLAFGRIPAGIGDVPANAVLINNGSANFGTPDELLGAAPTYDIHAGDVNSDGLTDLVFINGSGVHQIWLASGSGFDLHAEQIVDQDSVAGVLTELGFTDVNEPGGVDLAMGGAVSGGIGVFLNDGAGNLGRGDAVPPVLTLLGSDPTEVPSGTSYVDSGASAEDNIDGNISGSIVVSNPVNTAVVGAYTVTYTVSDFAGNQATPITRTVNVVPAAGSGGGGGGAVNGWLLLLCLLMLGWHWRLSRPRPQVIKHKRTLK